MDMETLNVCANIKLSQKALIEKFSDMDRKKLVVLKMRNEIFNQIHGLFDILTKNGSLVLQSRNFKDIVKDYTNADADSVVEEFNKMEISKYVYISFSVKTDAFVVCLTN